MFLLGSVESVLTRVEAVRADFRADIDLLATLVEANHVVAERGFEFLLMKTHWPNSLFTLVNSGEYRR